MTGVTVKHRFTASAERVYDAWLDPEKARKFLYATATGEIVRCEVDARVGGKYVIVDRRNGEDVLHEGTYLELERPRRIVFTVRVPKYSPDEDRVTIDIKPLAPHTHAVVEPAPQSHFALAGVGCEHACLSAARDDSGVA